MILLAFVTYFHYLILAFILPVMPFNSGKLYSADDKNYHPAWVINDGSGLGTVVDLVVPLIM